MIATVQLLGGMGYLCAALIGSAYGCRVRTLVALGVMHLCAGCAIALFA